LRGHFQSPSTVKLPQTHAAYFFYEGCQSA
jgi:hypothetical protein